MARQKKKKKTTSRVLIRTGKEWNERQRFFGGHTVELKHSTSPMGLSSADRDGRVEKRKKEREREVNDPIVSDMAIFVAICRYFAPSFNKK